MNLILMARESQSNRLLGVRKASFIASAAGIPAGDALIVLRSNGPKAAAYGVHGATALVMLVISVLLLVA